MDFVFRRSYRGRLRAIVLDWAGTTVDWGCMAPTEVFVKVFEEKQVPITVTQARMFMGKHKRDHIAALCSLEDVAKRWREVHGHHPTPSDIDEMFAAYLPLQLQTLAHHAELVPGLPDAVRAFRSRRLKIGSTTGYTREMMDVLVPEALRRGYDPDTLVCASDVPAGRPAPWMCFRNAIDLQVYPMEACVKVGDTPQDILEGLNAGMWTVGVLMSGNEIGMSEQDIQMLDPSTYKMMRERARDRLYQAGAHFVVDTIADVPDVLDDISTLLIAGEKP